MTEETKTIELSQLQTSISAPPVVYFCAEFAIDTNLPVYAGGLGVLAGDILAQANEDGRAYVGVGMYYHKGYMRQEISKEANLYIEDPVDKNQARLLLVTEKGVPVTVRIPIHARTVKIQAWVKIVGTVPLILLDTDVEGNEQQDVNLCDRLYHGDREHRFKQEMILGLGGLRMVHRLGIEARLYHLNEGHSALMLFELAHACVKKGEAENIQQALEKLDTVVFTNHTLVPEGNDVFSKDLVISYLSSYAIEIPIDPAVLARYGLIQDSSLFSPTMLALRLSKVSQAVSQLHGKKALEVWSDHPMVSVTNGVRAKFWQTNEINQAKSQDDRALWNAHLTRKKKLLSLIKDITHFEWPDDAFVLGWARRLANYKQPLLLFSDIERLQKLLSHLSVPVRLVLSGKPHAHDDKALETLRKILEYVGQLNGQVVYLQNYTLDMAKDLLSGVDVLLNTPVRGFEACGTSGMKAGLNGVLSCTTLDGWTDEVDWKGLGWALPENLTAATLYDTIEKEILPLYLQKDENGLPIEWLSRMRKMITLIEERYTAKRMLDEYERLVYSQLKK